MEKDKEKVSSKIKEIAKESGIPVAEKDDNAKPEEETHAQIDPGKYIDRLERIAVEATGTEKKTLNITEEKGAKASIKDIKIYGNGDTFALLCKASSEKEGWMKSTKVCNVGSDCIVQVTTQQRNIDGNYVIAEALTTLKNANIDTESDPRVIRVMNGGYLVMPKQ